MQDDQAIIDGSLKDHRDATQAFERLIPAVKKIHAALSDLVRRDGLLMLCGNGGSAADCQHWAAEWRIRFLKNDRRALRAEALTTNTSVLTAAGNDFGFERVFSRQIEAIGRKGDALIAISTSGNSPNILRAVEAAKQRGITTIGFGGGDGGKMAKMVDIPFVVDSPATSRIQEMHELAMHIICELIDREVLAAQGTSHA